MTRRKKGAARPTAGPSTSTTNVVVPKQRCHQGSLGHSSPCSGCRLEKLHRPRPPQDGSQSHDFDEIPGLVVSKILNHTESGITAVHDRQSYDLEKREALDRWAGRMEEMLCHQVESSAKVAETA